MQKTNIYKTMKSLFWFFFSNFKLRPEILWLAASWLPWQPRQKSGFMVLCELFLSTTLPILKVLQKLVFELRLLPCLTNQKPSLVTMATRLKLKRQPFSKSTGHGLRGGISSMWAGIQESAQIWCWKLGCWPLNPPLNKEAQMNGTTGTTFFRVKIFLWVNRTLNIFCQHKAL